MSSGSANAFSGFKPTSTETSAGLTLGKDSNQNGFKTISSDSSQVPKPSSSSFNDNLKALNESVVAWIQKHVKLNPYIDLTPIFNDYKEHMKNIDIKFSSSANERDSPSSASPATGLTNQPVMTSLFSAPPQPTERTEEKKTEAVNTGKRFDLSMQFLKSATCT